VRISTVSSISNGTSFIYSETSPHPFDFSNATVRVLADGQTHRHTHTHRRKPIL